jgi:hypothetical protein
MKTQTIRLSESKLKEMIKNAINEFKDDYRNPDFMYIRPNGDDNIGTKLNYRSGEKAGKRAKINFKYDINGKTARFNPITGANKFMDGKGQLCYKLANAADEILQVNGKVVWTDKEKEAIRDIKNAIGDLAQLTKEEGNEKRGYNGPKKDEKPE